MRATIEAAAAAAVLLLGAAPALALTPVSTPTRAAQSAARFLSSGSEFDGRVFGLQGSPAVAGFAPDAASSFGYLLSAEPKARTKGEVERYFENDLVTYRAPGTTIVYAPAAKPAAAAPAR